MKLLAAVLTRLIKIGTLTVIDARGRQYHFQGDMPGPALTMRLSGRWTALKIALNPGLYFGEAYMNGQLTVDGGGTIYELMDLLTRNTGWGAGRRLVGGGKVGRWIRSFNPQGRARANVAHHYDLSDELYELFLDEDRQYSCGYFRSPDDDLETAQRQKMELIAAKLRLKPGQRVLDIGCGWGGLARHLVRAHNVMVTGVTLSENQYEYARTHPGSKAVGSHLSFAQEDYREVSARFDRVVSVGMFEHVGVPHYDEYFQMIRRTLTDDGVALVHTIGAASGSSATNAWISKYIFPGGHVPSLSEASSAIERAGLYVTDLEILRLHYAETLKAWRRRFLANRAKAAALYDERFCRMWEFYLVASETAFRNGDLVVFQFQLAKKQDAVPLTRDYLLNIWPTKTLDTYAARQATEWHKEVLIHAEDEASPLPHHRHSHHLSEPNPDQQKH
ncbi:SAM-dependent methyltransferase [Kordiimonas marina]|uniref:SAM-dependent methyltransferase n=1 Tax=Kordiimonas marina TaxID=2872312 RepID=UPI001FF677B3|nr:cyclopropane-fatty-acyl-phospholipid synthase family protein [Kordiimonas marina]MCJ9428807.1 cyclopropane-fatty-acyl-phospholipid synthase family protein [Kordiimonas marina]